MMMYFLKNFLKLIEDYNTGSNTLEEQYEKLIKLTKDLNVEEQRAVKNDMTDQELELFDLLKKEKLTKKEEKEVKLAAKALLQKLFDTKNKILIQEWHKEKATQEIVRREIQKILGTHLPDPGYGRQLFAEKLAITYQHFYDLAERGMGFYA